MIAKILSEAKISYIKWDMNRSITECYSIAYPAERQGEISIDIYWECMTYMKD